MGSDFSIESRRYLPLDTCCVSGIRYVLVDGTDAENAELDLLMGGASYEPIPPTECRGKGSYQACRTPACRSSVGMLGCLVSRSDAASSERTRTEGVGPVPWGGAETASDSDYSGAGRKHHAAEHAVHSPPLPHAAVLESDRRRTQRVFQGTRMNILTVDDAYQRSSNGTPISWRRWHRSYGITPPGTPHGSTKPTRCSSPRCLSKGAREGDYMSALARSKVRILRCIPFSGQFGWMPQVVRT